MDDATAWENKVGITFPRKPRLGPAALFLLGCFACAGAVSAAPFPATQCAADRFGEDLTCTAQDVQITGMSVVGDTTSCVGGDPVTLDLQMTVNFGNPSRYDIGIFISTDGNDPQTTSANGGAAACAVSVLPIASPFLDLDGGSGDTCGDGNGTIGGGSGSGIHYMPNVTVPCQSLAGGGGNLYIPFVVSWDSNAGTLCQSSLDAVPGGKPKCNSPTIAQGSVSVVVLPTISNSDGIATIASGGTTDYSIVITNTTGVALSNAVLTDPAVSGIAANTLTCVAAGGATCPAGGTVAALQGAGITLPAMPAGGSLTFTLNATLTGNPSDTRTNTARVAVGGQSNAAGDTDTIVDVIAILPPSLARSGAKGAAVVYTYAVHNFGAGTDTIGLAAVSSQGWSVTPSAASVSVPAGGSVNITVTVDIPPGAPLGTVDSTLITATSGNDPGLTATAAAVTTVAALLTLVPSDTGTGSAGSYAYYNHRVQNNASTDQTVSLTQSFTAGSCAGWTSALFEVDQTTSLATPVGLSANGGFKDFVLKVSIPFGATVASTCEATVTAAFTSGSPNAVSVTDTTTVKNLLLYADPGYTTPQDTYPVGNSVYGKVFGLATGTAYYYKWLDPDGTTRRTSPITSGLVSLPDAYTIPGAGPLGTWTVQIWNDTTNTIFEQTDFYVGPDHLAATFAGGSQATNTDVVIALALHDKIDHVEPFDGSGGLVKGNPTDPEGPLMITVTVSGSAVIVETTLANATITGQTVTGKLIDTSGTATITIRDAVPETVTVTPASYKSVLIGSPDRDESVAVSFIYVASIDHFRLDHAGSALTCQRAEVTVRACQTANCATLYPDPVSVTLLPSGWIGGNDQTVTGGAATAFKLRHTTAETVTLGISASSVPATNPIQCYVAGVAASCNLPFATSGFVFDVPNLTSCTASGDVAIAAVKADPSDPEACIADGGFAGVSKDIKFWSSYVTPATGTKALQVAGSAVATASPGTTVTLAFDAGAQSSFTVAYADAGQVQLDARYAGSGEEAGLVMTGADTFVVKPARLDIVATTDGVIALNNGVSTGTPIWPAGDDFFVEVQAVCNDATVTPNFAAATTVAASAPYQPATGTLGSLSNGAIAATDYSAGVATKSGIQYPEVGTVTLTAAVADYLGAGAVSGSSGLVGRFVPHHFRLNGIPVLTTRTDLTCAPASAFTYMAEPFAVQFVLEAQNAADVLTANYTGAYAKLNPTTAVPFGFGAVSPAGPTALTARLDLGLAPTGSWFNGAGDFTVTLALNRGAAGMVDGPFDDLALGMAPVDPDAVAYRAADLDLDTDGDAIAERIRLATTQLRFGRLRLDNAYGPELLPLNVPLRAEYFDGSGFAANAADSCTTYDGTSAILGNFQFNLHALETTAAGASTLVNGAENSATPLQLSAPGGGNDGSVDVTLPTSAWLRFDWDGDTVHDNNPTCRASFGIYKGNPRLIYLREVIP